MTEGVNEAKGVFGRWSWQFLDEIRDYSSLKNLKRCMVKVFSYLIPIFAEQNCIFPAVGIYRLYPDPKL